MKAIIKCVRPEHSWTSNFDSMHPYMLPVLCKPMIDFYIDYCLLCGVSEIVIIAEEYDAAFFAHIKSMNKWGTPISIGLDEADNPIKREACDIFFDKFSLICYDKNYKTSSENIVNFRSDYKDIIDTDFLENINAIETLPPIVPLKIDSLKKYFDINMSLLNKYTSCFLMKGYGGEDAVFMGMNDVVMYKTQLRPPLVIDDNTQIESACRIGSSIIGILSLIDRRTSIKNCIVFDRTYVAENQTIEGKIIFRQYIIDPTTEEKTRMLTSFEMSDTYAYIAIKALARVFERTLALLLFILLSPFSLLSFIFGKPQFSEIELTGKENRKWKIRYYLRSSRLRDIYFFKFSQDKLPLLWAAVLGKIRLVGDSIQVARDAKNMKFYGKHYRVGAFNYAGSIGKKDFEWRVMDDLHYKNHRSIRTDLQVILRTLVSRIFGDQSK